MKLKTYWQNLTQYQKPKAPRNPYIGPPKLIRYTLERWTYEDEVANEHSGETWAPTLCMGCFGMCGDYHVGEWVVDDTTNTDTFHIICVPKRVRWLAVLGTLLCTIRPAMGIDKF